jgi:hypothetical protein
MVVPPWQTLKPSSSHWTDLRKTSHLDPRRAPATRLHCPGPQPTASATPPAGMLHYRVG